MTQPAAVLTAREVPLGGPRAMTVYRTLPQRSRAMVGPWCFLDHYGPDDVGESGGMQVYRHPHTGLATVSWLFQGGIDHVDSAGNVAEVRPGELNLMIAGSGITHQEISTPETTHLHGIQLWYVLPEGNRFQDHEFHHYVPQPVSGYGYSASVFIGVLAGDASPVSTSTLPMVGAELTIEPNATIALDLNPEFEHAVLAENQAVIVQDQPLEHRDLAYLYPDTDTLTIHSGPRGARMILIGGQPFEEEIVMWWNFIGRSHEEVEEFRRRYQSELGFDPVDPRDQHKPSLFGPYPAGQPDPWPAPAMPSLRLRPRNRHGQRL